ncbi:AAA family ATPase [Paratractidigestivibacter sp.]|uniref:AAA family ATPase n=1 Tax=Paratractidigestivibacter sp. TaxID=2847316 RepID=UPI002ABE70D1|nr:AAA family ATPase [Paratractidigestivibacter sp.]
MDQQEPIFSWVDNYTKLADALLAYKDDRQALLRKLSDAYAALKEQTGLEYKLVHVDGNPFEDIDPFTVYGSFNRHLTRGNRIATFNAIASALGVEGTGDAMDFAGIPVLNNRRVWFFHKPTTNEGRDVQNLWDLFESALALADGKEADATAFEQHYDAALKQWGISWNITMALYWVRPNRFINLDGLNREYLKAKLGVPAKELTHVPAASDYLHLCDLGIQSEAEGDPLALPKLSLKAWQASEGAKGEATVIDSEPASWLYAPGNGASHWEADLQSGTMGIGWAELGDLADYASQDELAAAIAGAYGEASSHKHDALACWQFQNEMQVGDIVYAKQGTTTILAHGVVASEPFYDEGEPALPHRREVEWEPLPEPRVCSAKFAQKTLTRLTNGALDKELKGLFENGCPSPKHVWLFVCNPHIWSFANAPVGKVHFYDLKNEKGNWRAKRSCFLAAKAGDPFLCYESSPVQGVIGGGVIAQEQDGEVIRFRKDFNLAEPLALDELRGIPELASSVFQTNLQGSLFELTGDEYSAVAGRMKAAGGDGPTLTEGAEPYGDADLLADVFISPERLAALKALVGRKKNVILQGAPGTGKTFLARRLAWDLIGAKDESKVELVQFHQSYAYEDFVQGLRPTRDGAFELREGVFHSFCRRAAARPDETFVFLIDEINRANVSKVFGELLMLIEAGHRGDPCTLAYSGERFSVPENLYIIGMMNTADRSLALMDYALRRRFGFFRMEPAFESDGFGAYVAGCQSEELARMVGRVRALNATIAADASLGEGFRIGHSYFCRDDMGDLGPDEVHEWLGSVVDYDIAPQLEEYWFDEPERAADEAARLRG